jgi:hypothetical protein
MASACYGHLEVVKILVKHGAELNIQDKVSHYRPLLPPTTCMHVHVCMYVCMYKRYQMCVCETYCRQVCAIDLPAYIPLSGMGICMYICMYVCMYVCMNVYIY